MTAMSSPATKSRKKGLDEDSFQKLLAAAFVVQEHNDRGKKLPQDELEDSTSDQSSDELNDIIVESRPAYAYVMEEIVATQHQIQTRRLELQQAMALIVERLLPIAHADGAAIALLEPDGSEIDYRVAVGRSSKLAGRRIKTEEALCSESVRNGATLQCVNTADDFRVDQKICNERGARGIIAVPVYRDEAVAGALELIFTKPGAFLDHDVRTCQLMAGMVTEALDRAADVEFKQALVNERATMLEALEKLKPQLERMVETTAVPVEPIDFKSLPSICSACGATFGEKDLKCVHCGLPRDSRVGNDTQSKLASAVRKNGTKPSATKTGQSSDNPAKNAAAPETPSNASLLPAPARSLHDSDSQQADFGIDELTSDEEFEIPSSVIDELEASLREYDPDRLVPDHLANDAESLEATSLNPELHSDDLLNVDVEDASDAASAEIEHEEPTPAELVDGAAGDVAEGMELRIIPTAPTEDAWTSASKAKLWLDSITDPHARTALARLIKHRKGEIYLGAAVLIVGFAVWWSVWGGGPSWKDFTNSSAGTATADGSSAATRRRPKPQEPELSLYEKFLISIGLAEAPPAPVNLGNPDVKVWVDLQTGLYYCPNADLYGHTPKGKFTTQRDAQLDQFEPGYRKTCE